MSCRRLRKPGSDYNLLDLNFAAPIVYGDPLNTNSKVGSLIYEMSTNTFRGLFADGNWRTVSQGFIAPTVQRFTSGSGTYTTPDGVLYITVEMVGGGGGGSGDRGVNPGGTGGDTTFGSAFLQAGGGTAGGNGGTVSLTGPAIALVTARGGAAGRFGNFQAATGGSGGVSFFAGNGAGGAGGGSPQAGSAADANTGSGGGGGGAPAASNSSDGGSAGGYIKALINAPLASYTYSIGSGGTGGAGGAGGTGGAGGNGADGVIIVTEYYQ